MRKIAVALLSAMMLAGCNLIGGMGSNADVQFTIPHITVIHEAFEPSKIRITTNVFTHKEPQQFEMHLQVYKWVGLPGKWVEWRREIFGKGELARVGHSTVFGLDFRCSKGYYYTKWTSHGITHDGHISSPPAEYYPWNPAKDKGLFPPKHKQGRHITSC